MEKMQSNYLDSFPSQESVVAQRLPLCDQSLSDFQLLRRLPGVKFRPTRMGNTSFDEIPLPPRPDNEIDADT